MIASERRYAGVVSRGAAFAVDIAVAVFACTVGFLFVRSTLVAIGVLSAVGDSSGAVGYVTALPLVFMAYCAAGWTLAGKTYGMMLLGLRVVTRDGSTPSALRSLARAAGYWVSAIAMIGFAWIAIDRRNQGFHDKIAGTFVVYDEPQMLRV